jgi:hypothetical protein
MNWEPTEHVSVIADWEETQSTMSVREESDRVSYKMTVHAMWKSEHFVKECKLLSTVWSWIINVTAAEITKKTTETDENSEKSSF